MLGAGLISDAFQVAWTFPGALRRFVADEGLTGVQIASGVVLLLALIGTVAAPLVLRRAAVASLGPFGRWRHAGASAAAWVAMFVLLLLYPLHYEIPLPIDNRWLPAANKAGNSGL